MRAVKFTNNLRETKRFMRFAAILATLLFSMNFVVASSAFAVVIGNPFVANPVVMTVAPPVAAKSDAAFVRPGVRPFFRPAFNPFFRPAFNPFFDVDVDVNPFFGEAD
jgi:hypothetical protein